MQPPPSHLLPPSSTSESTPSSPALARLESLLRQALRVVVEDGRVFLGTFAGTDKPLNILLINTEEYRLGMGDMYDGRFVGQVLIPWRLVVKIEAQRQGTPDDASLRDPLYM